MHSEILDIVNETGEVLGQATRAEIHRRRLLHRVVHLLVFNSKGELLLQKRSQLKDIAPGKWDTSVGGHVEHGETIDQALRREMEEELGFYNCETAFQYSYIHSNAVETELVYSFRCSYEGEIRFNPLEITEIRFWDLSDIRDALGSDIFSENFRDEFGRYLRH